MSGIKDGGAAFPVLDTHALNPHLGMTLRDYFAAKAMQAIYMRLGGSPVDTDVQGLEYTAKWAYAQADAMLKAREV
jgi:hypothetical protein